MLLYGQWYGEIQERLEAFGLTDAPRAGIDKMRAVARGGDELSAAVNTEPLTVVLVLGDLASEAKGRVEAFDHSAAVGREHAVLPPRGRGGTGRDSVPQLALQLERRGIRAPEVAHVGGSEAGAGRRVCAATSGCRVVECRSTMVIGGRRASLELRMFTFVFFHAEHGKSPTWRVVDSSLVATAIIRLFGTAKLK